MDNDEISSIDSLLEELGGCGLFQIVIVFVVHEAIIGGTWSMSFMAFGNYNPGWTCHDNTDFNSSVRLGYVNDSTPYDKESSCDAHTQCNNVVYSKDASTIATEWDIVCDRKWISNLMISMQMVGVLFGALLAGHLSFTLGRKITLYGSLAVHAVLNLVTSFSINWPMFTVMRFLIGITSGSILLSSFVYPMEFVVNRWRGFAAALPFSATGRITFALTAMLLRDWRQIHRATTVLALVLILPVVWVPDSLRWLSVKSKTIKAEKVALQIAKLNRKPVPNMDILKSIAENERLIEENKPHFTILDLYRHGLLRQTLILSSIWLTNTMVFYFLLYDIQSLSGNLFVNMMLFPCVSLVTLPLVPMLTNTIGRRFGIILLVGLAAVCSLILVCMNFVDVDVDKALARRVLTFLLIIVIDSNWTIAILLNIELYPTVLRPLSYSHGSSVGRFGGMLAPFLIPRDPSTMYIPQIVLLALFGFNCFCLFFLPETKGKPLEESVTLNGRKRKEQEADVEV